MYIISFILWLKNTPLYGYTHFVYLFIIDEHFGCLHLLAIMNNASMNIHVHIFVWTYVFISFLYS